MFAFLLWAFTVIHFTLLFLWHWQPSHGEHSVTTSHTQGDFQGQNTKAQWISLSLYLSLSHSHTLAHTEANTLPCLFNRAHSLTQLQAPPAVLDSPMTVLRNGPRWPSVWWPSRLSASPLPQPYVPSLCAPAADCRETRHSNIIWQCII